MTESKRILIVDDDEDILLILKERVEELDFLSPPPVIELAEDGLKALSMVRGCQYDLLLVDFLMPKLGGLQLIETIRNEEGVNRHIPILCLSGYLPKIQESTPAAILENVMFLEKPFTDAKFEKATRLLLLNFPK